MKIFLCAGEASGDIHGANLIRALRASDPAVECAACPVINPHIRPR